MSIVGSIIGSAGGGGGGGGTPATLTSLVPSPTSPVGSGGFPADRGLADATPVTFKVMNASFVIVTATLGSNPETIVYRDGVFVNQFAKLSSQALPSLTEIDFSILPVGGWGGPFRLTIDAVGGDGLGVRFQYSWLYPSLAAPYVPAVVAAGSLDLVSQAFDELPWQLGEVGS